MKGTRKGEYHFPDIRKKTYKYMDIKEQIFEKLVKSDFRNVEGMRELYWPVIDSILEVVQSLIDEEVKKEREKIDKEYSRRLSEINPFVSTCGKYFVIFEEWQYHEGRCRKCKSLRSNP